MRANILCRRFCTKSIGKNVLNDFDFSDVHFSKNMMKLVTQEPMPSLEEVRKQNNSTLEGLKKKAAFDLDPFSIIDDDLKFINNIIFDNIIDTKYSLLKEVAEYNLKLKGKNFRSCIIMLLSRAFYSKYARDGKKFEDTDLYYTSALLSACVEICHNATLLQDDIIDQAETRRSKLAAYKVYGRSNSVFASNFLISRASQMLAKLEKPYLSQIFSTMIYNLVFGELIQARNYSENDSLEESVRSYISKTYYKTASLMSLACRGVGVIYNFSEEKQRNAFDFGAHFGIAFQIADDILDFTQSSEALGKPAFNDLKSGLVTAPTIFAFSESKSKDLETMIQRNFENEGDVDKALSIIDSTAGIDRAEMLALNHVGESIAALACLDEIDIGNDAYQGLVKLTLKVKTRKY
ncbi:unnamed protein product [Moneuplotes crassus]|uniref:Uncharacterized protein n=1 Tax=Euplotes crassus TaxID=5936 RepID=A0AAD1XCQ3_EUPCR|nr:unnamed protein product [Moneuplotes crassus]